MSNTWSRGRGHVERTPRISSKVEGVADRRVPRPAPSHCRGAQARGKATGYCRDTTLRCLPLQREVEAGPAIMARSHRRIGATGSIGLDISTYGRAARTGRSIAGSGVPASPPTDRDSAVSAIVRTVACRRFDRRHLRTTCRRPTARGPIASRTPSGSAAVGRRVGLRADGARRSKAFATLVPRAVRVWQGTAELRAARPGAPHSTGPARAGSPA